MTGLGLIAVTLLKFVLLQKRQVILEVFFRRVTKRRSLDGWIAMLPQSSHWVVSLPDPRFLTRTKDPAFAEHAEVSTKPAISPTRKVCTAT